MTISELTNQNQWQQFIDTLEPHTFLQDWEWGDVQKKLGSTIWRLGLSEGEDLWGVALVVKVVARRGSFLFVPHGPLIKKEKYSAGLKALSDYLKELSEKENCSFFRISPLIEDLEVSKEIFENLDYRNAPTHMHPELAWILDLEESEEKLLSNMRKNTRYSVRKAEKDGVEIEITEDKERLKDFFPVYDETAERQNFTPFAKRYLETEYELLNQAGKVLLFFAKFEGEIVSVAMIVVNKTSAFYHHGASSQKNSQLTASHLLQWSVIKEAKRRGCKMYNFWGIAPPDKPKHPWAGLSRFKMGFGGHPEAYVHAQDMVIKPSYWLNYGIEYVRRLRRRL